MFQCCPNAKGVRLLAVPRPGAARRGRRVRNVRAFTLLELLVTVALLGMMVGIVANVLSQSSKVVTFSEAKIRQNNAAASLSQVLRDYLRKASKNGILCITEVGVRPRLILTTVGTASSITGTGKGDAAFTILGLVDNQASFGDSNTRLLWMPTRVLSKLGGVPGTDIWTNDFSEYQGLTRQLVNDSIINNALCTGAINNLSVPAVTIGDVNLLWQVAGTGVSSLSIQWTDGSIDPGPPSPSLKWYGRDINGNLNNTNVLDPAWTGRTVPPQSGATFNLDDRASLQTAEYNAGSLVAPIYRALWTQANQNYWPKAIKIRFTLTDASMPQEFQAKDTDYEVIGTIGQ